MSLDQDVGVLQGQVEALQKMVATLETNLTSLDTGVKELTESISTVNTAIEKVIAEGKGGWKIIGVIGTVSATFASAVAWAATHIKVN